MMEQADLVFFLQHVSYAHESQGAWDVGVQSCDVQDGQDNLLMANMQVFYLVDEVCSVPDVGLCSLN